MPEREYGNGGDGTVQHFRNGGYGTNSNTRLEDGSGENGTKLGVACHCVEGSGAGSAPSRRHQKQINRDRHCACRSETAPHPLTHAPSHWFVRPMVPAQLFNGQRSTDGTAFSISDLFDQQQKLSSLSPSMSIHTPKSDGLRAQLLLEDLPHPTDGPFPLRRVFSANTAATEKGAEKSQSGDGYWSCTSPSPSSPCSSPASPLSPPVAQLQLQKESSSQQHAKLPDETPNWVGTMNDDSCADAEKPKSRFGFPVLPCSAASKIGGLTAGTPLRRNAEIANTGNPVIAEVAEHSEKSFGGFAAKSDEAIEGQFSPSNSVSMLNSVLEGTSSPAQSHTPISRSARPVDHSLKFISFSSIDYYQQYPLPSLLPSPAHCRPVLRHAQSWPPPKGTVTLAVERKSLVQKVCELFKQAASAASAQYLDASEREFTFNLRAELFWLKTAVRQSMRCLMNWQVREGGGDQTADAKSKSLILCSLTFFFSILSITASLILCLPNSKTQ